MYFSSSIYSNQIKYELHHATCHLWLIIDELSNDNLKYSHLLDTIIKIYEGKNIDGYTMGLLIEMVLLAGIIWFSIDIFMNGYEIIITTKRNNKLINK